MDPYIVRLFHLITVKGFIGLFYSTDDFPHGYQSAYFFFFYQQCFHYMTSRVTACGSALPVYLHLSMVPSTQQKIPNPPCIRDFFDNFLPLSSEI
jgi:hypothetical protein